MKVVEKFISLNGEGARSGEPSVFVRFKGCNLNCSYCDTKWANEPGCGYEEMSPEEIRDYISASGIRNVTLTGGEPLIAKDIDKLIALLLSDPFLRVEIETNGSADIAPFCKDRRPVFTMDYKLPSSGCEDAMRTGNFSLLAGEDTVKFVVSGTRDLERALEIIRKYDLPGRCGVYLSPVFGKADLQEMASFIINNKLNDVRMQVQLHKVIWDPSQRGV